LLLYGIHYIERGKLAYFLTQLISFTILLFSANYSQ